MSVDKDESFKIWSDLTDRAKNTLKNLNDGATNNDDEVPDVEDEESIKEDIQLLADGINLLQLDYLGGHGSRGYGRVSFRDFAVEAFSLDRDYGKQLADMTQELTTILEGCC